MQLATTLREATDDFVVLANDPSSSRLGALTANARRCGVEPWLAVARGDAGALFNALPAASADLILVANPAS